MRFSVRVKTSAAACAVFDPQALQAWRACTDPYEVLHGVEDEVTDGHMLLYNPAADGEYEFLFLVEERPSPQLISRSYGSITNVLLRVPSGALVVAGIEALPAIVASGGEVPMSATQTVRSGAYRVDAHNLEVMDDCEGSDDDESADALFVLQRIDDPETVRAMRGGTLAL